MFSWRRGVVLLLGRSFSLPGPGLARAWTDVGHMLVARIAALGLESTRPEVLEFFSSIAGGLFTEGGKVGRLCRCRGYGPGV